MGGTQTASALYASQRAAKAQPGGEQGAKDQNLIFWVHAETDVLRARLDARVDTMITNGMWEEIEEMETLYLASSKGQLDLNAGIWQSIGFKEFLPYLELRRMGEATETQLEVARNVAIENMKTATRQYAKTQVRWLRIKLLNALRSSKQVDGNGKIFLLDSTDLPHYSERVVVPALDIAKGTLPPPPPPHSHLVLAHTLGTDFLLHKPLPDPLSLSPLAEACLTPKRDYDISQRPDLWKQRTCTICEVTTTNDPEWGYHIKSNKHKKKLAGVAKRKEIDEFLKNRERKKLAVEQEGREADEVLPEL